MKGDELREVIARKLIAQYKEGPQTVIFSTWIQWQTDGVHHYSKQVQRIAKRIYYSNIKGGDSVR